MTSQDLPVFLAACRGLEQVFPLRGTDDELQQVRAAYFSALKPYTVAQVEAGADRWLQTGTKFPKPAEWIGAMPPREVGGGLRHLSDDDARAYRSAELARYEGTVCDCSACRAAGVTAAQPLRFVPDVDADDREIQAFDPIGQRVVTTGHWAHGAELKRWYAAKAKFYANFHELCATRVMQQPKTRANFQQRMDAIFKPKPEPVK